MANLADEDAANPMPMNRRCLDIQVDNSVLRLNRLQNSIFVT